MKNYQYIYFIGIGGIGMSALARYFFFTEKITAMGYDKTPSTLTKKLENEGIYISYEDDVDSIPEKVIHNKEQTLVVYTPAIPKDSILLNYFKNKKYTVRKRAEVLGDLSSKYFTVAVGGTHGKTTTTALIAHLLIHAGKNMVGFVGGIMKKYNSNLLIYNEELKEKKASPILVVEADEFDRSFLLLNPNITVLTSADADHLDIYGDEKALEETMRKFILLTPAQSSSYVQYQAASKLWPSLSKLPKVIKTYGLVLGESCAEFVEFNGREISFDFIGEKEVIRDIVWSFPGLYNIENAIAAINITLQLGISPDLIKAGISSFKGLKRRFEYIIDNKYITYIDDYAHHPTEVMSFIQGVKTAHPGRRVVAIFQPHLFSRTRDFLQEFAESLSLVDELILMPIYPAREQPITGITSEAILNKVTLPHKYICKKSGLFSLLSNCLKSGDILLSIGAGDIGEMVIDISEYLKENFNLG